VPPTRWIVCGPALSASEIVSWLSTPSFSRMNKSPPTVPRRLATCVVNGLSAAPTCPSVSSHKVPARTSMPSPDALVTAPVLSRNVVVLGIRSRLEKVASPPRSVSPNDLADKSIAPALPMPTAPVPPAAPMVTVPVDTRRPKAAAVKLNCAAGSFKPIVRESVAGCSVIPPLAVTFCWISTAPSMVMETRLAAKLAAPAKVTGPAAGSSSTMVKSAA